MSQHTNIEWADSTLNFWSGCTKVSAGCAHCYAETLSNRALTNKTGERTIGLWGRGAARKRHQSAFNLALRLNKQPFICDHCGTGQRGAVAMDEGCENRDCPSNLSEHVQGLYHRRRVFSLSLGDWLDPEVPIEWLAEMLRVIDACREVQWLLVTKRPELFHQRMHDVWAGRAIQDRAKGLALAWSNGSPAGTNPDGSPMFDVPPHVVVLASAENQEQAEARIPELFRIPAWRRGLSCEPLLGPINLRRIFGHESEKDWLDWVIIGGESGPQARPCNVAWVESLKDQCQSNRVPVFVKQLGQNSVTTCTIRLGAESLTKDYPSRWRDKKGGDLTEWPPALQVREFYQSAS